MKKIESLNKIEPFLYFSLLILQILPVVLLNPFVSLDGAAHLYNGRLINTLFFENNSLTNHFFEFIKFPEPNWSCHAFTALLMVIMPAWLADKIVILSILILGALGFRLLTFELNPKSGWMSWMYFPLLYNFAFNLGFYNFSFGFSLLTFVLVFWLRNRNKNFSITSLVILILASFVLYFSHLLIFLLSALFMLLISIIDLFLNDKRIFQKQLRTIILIFLPGLIISIVFVFLGKSSTSLIEYNSLADRINYIFSAGILVFFDFEKESFATRIYFLVLLLISIWSLKYYSFHRFQNAMLRILICTFLLIFIVPNTMASGSIITTRMVQLFYLSWYLWIIALNIPIKNRITIAFISVGFSFFFIARSYSTRSELSDFANSYYQASERMEEGSLVLPLNYDLNWLHVHLCGYLGAEKRIVVLKNYEATTKHFPIVWKDGMDPELHLGDFPASRKPCINIRNFENFTGLKINYITVQSKPEIADDSCTKSTFHQIDSLFQQLPNWTDQNVKIYVRRK